MDRKRGKVRLIKRNFAMVVNRRKYAYVDILTSGFNHVPTMKSCALSDKTYEKIRIRIMEYFRNGLVPQSAVKFPIGGVNCDKLNCARLLLLLSLLESDSEHSLVFLKNAIHRIF